VTARARGGEDLVSVLGASRRLLSAGTGGEEKKSIRFSFKVSHPTKFFYVNLPYREERHGKFPKTAPSWYKYSGLLEENAG
jgi:hypothetical protein